MANSNDYKEIGLNSDKNKNIAESSPSSDFDRLEDCNEAEFRGATLSLSPQETSPPESVAANACGEGAPAEEEKRRSSSLRAPPSSNVQDFFAVREGALQKAAEKCRPVILESMDGALRGIWLLTEIDHWDTEKERLLFLTDRSLIALKFDFITLKLLDYTRHALKDFQKITVGELKYPEKSLMPKINGAMDFFRQRVLPKLRQGRNFRQPTANTNTNLALVDNKPRSAVARHQLGVQCSWSPVELVSAAKRWNPWSRDIPFVTYTSHPLLQTDTSERNNYNIEDFCNTLTQVLQGGGGVGGSPVGACQFVYQPIVIESYVGLASALHNANELGFFKSRGKVSF